MIHKKIKYLDAYYQISNDSLKRIANAAGCVYITDKCCDTLKLTIRDVLDNWCKNIAIFTEHARKKIIDKEAVLEGLRVANTKIYTTGDSTVKKCKIKKTKGSLEKIKFYQEQTDCVYLSIKKFSDIVRGRIILHNAHLKFSVEGLSILQIALEDYIIKLLQKAVLIIINCGRKMVTEKEIDLINKIQKLS